MFMDVLPSRTSDDVSVHFSEAFSYFKNWLISFLCVSIILSLFIDEIIVQWINAFNLQLSQLTVYSPDRWLRMKWGTLMLAGFIITVPYASLLLNRFVSPGLFSFERTLISRLILFSTLLVFTFIPYCWYILTPSIMLGLSDFTKIDQLSENYDISMIYTIVLGITWALVITIISLTSQVVSALLVSRENIESNPIKWRIHMITLFVLYLVLSGPLSPIWLPLSIVIILLTDWIHNLIPNKSVALIQPGYPTMNNDGSTNRIAILDCKCEDSCPSLTKIPNNAAVIRTQSICLNQESNDFLINLLKSNNYSKLVVTGCNGKPLPNNTKMQIEKESIELIGLSWLDQRGYHPEDTELAKVRRELQIENECSASSSYDKSIVIDDPGWGRYIPRGYISLPQNEEI